MIKLPFPLLFVFFSFQSCDSEPDEIKTTINTVSYTESAVDFPNPERGFYHYTETRASSPDPLSEQQLKNFRNPHKPGGGSYTMVSTLVFRYYVLDNFTESEISQAYLDGVSDDFAVARAAGVKLIPRFTYTIDVTDGDCPESFICPPYGDASKAVVLQHIAQLKPILTENADVIMCVQVGFIGTWGENYYTDYFGDASSNGQQKLFDENWQDRIDVVNALLDATPEEIMIQVRYPQLKQRVVYGINAPVSSAPLTEAEAFSGTDKARLAFHNDCFLASSDDYGTYEDYGNSSTPRGSANTTLRNYFSEDSRYVVVGGETCSDGYSPQNDCGPNGKAEDDMRKLHYTFLNSDYNNQVNNDWVTGGCMESIQKNLGYRIVLREGKFPSHVKVSELLEVEVLLENTGFTSPVKARPVELILRNLTSGSKSTFQFDTDIRKWFTGEITLNGSFDISAVEAGDYELLLNLPDGHETLAERPEYSIRLANDAVWEEETGFNTLSTQVTIVQ